MYIVLLMVLLSNGVILVLLQLLVIVFTYIIYLGSYCHFIPECMTVYYNTWSQRSRFVTIFTKLSQTTTVGIGMYIVTA